MTTQCNAIMDIVNDYNGTVSEACETLIDWICAESRDAKSQEMVKILRDIQSGGHEMFNRIWDKNIKIKDKARLIEKILDE